MPRFLLKRGQVIRIIAELAKQLLKETTSFTRKGLAGKPVALKGMAMSKKWDQEDVLRCFRDEVLPDGSKPGGGLPPMPEPLQKLMAMPREMTVRVGGNGSGGNFNAA